MSQNSLVLPTTGTLSGLQAVQDVNNALDTLNTLWGGSSAPSSPEVGQYWLNTSASPYVLSLWDGADWNPVGALDTTNHVWCAQIGGGIATVASASTTDLSSFPQASATVTGTTAINSFGTMAGSGQFKFLTFAASLTVNVGADVILPGGVSIITSPGDTMFFQNQGGGVWACAAVLPASGLVSLTSGGFKNFITGGDFGTNPWQLGTAFGGLTGALAYTADCWFYATSGATNATVSKQASSLTGLPYELRLQRAAGNASTANHIISQVIESVNTQLLQGQLCTLSFYARCGANYSPTSANLRVIAAYGGGTDEGSTLYNAGAWTSYTQLVNYNQPLTTSHTRYQVSFTVPTTANEFGVSFMMQPTGTAGTADWFAVEGVQLQLGGYSTPFERLPEQVVLAQCQRYCYKTFPQATTPAQNVGSTAGVVAYRATASGVASFSLPVNWPVTMRAAPSLTFYNPSAANGKWRNVTQGTDSGPPSSDVAASDAGMLLGNTQVSGDTAANLLGVHLVATAWL